MTYVENKVEHAIFSKKNIEQCVIKLVTVTVFILLKIENASTTAHDAKW